MGDSCILFTLSLFLFLQWKLPADGRVGRVHESVNEELPLSFINRDINQTICDLMCPRRHGINSHYLNDTSGVFYCTYACVHIRHLLIRFTPPYLKYKYDTSTRDDWMHAVHDIFVVFPSLNRIILRRHFAKSYVCTITYTISVSKTIRLAQRLRR